MKKHSFLKIAVIALFAAILFSLLAFSVSAATASVNSETVLRGEEVTFTATLSDAFTVGSGSVAVVYDSDTLELVGGNTAGIWNVGSAMITHFDAANALGAFMFQGTGEVSGDVFSVTFKVKDTAPFETTDVELNITLRDGSNADIALTNTKGSVTVECVHSFTAQNTAETYKVSGATCTAKAVYNYSCVHCGAEGTDTFEYGDFADHTFTKQIITDDYKVSGATCTAKAVYNFACAVCDAEGTTTYEYGDKLPHTFTKQIITDAYKVSGATCTAKAVYNYACDVCDAEGTTTYEYGEMLDHTFTKQIITDEYKVSSATCTAKAVYNYACNGCNLEGTDTFEYGDLADHIFIKRIITDDYKVSGATCTAKAVYNYACDACDAESNIPFEYGEKLPHTFTKQIITDDYKVSNANCVDKAVYNYACSVCDAEGDATFEYGETADHDYTKQIITDEYKVSSATCTAKAVYNYACAGCDLEGTLTFEYGEKLPHTFTKQIITDDYKVSGATCTAKAVYNYACDVCDTESDITFEYGEKLDHEYTKQIITDEYKVSSASCTAKAVYNYACKGCDLEGTDTFEYGEKLPHDFTKQIITDDYKVSSASCTAKAVYNYACSVCDEEGTTTFEYGEKLPHDFTKQIITDDYKVSSATCMAKAVYNYACQVCELESDITFEYGEKNANNHTNLGVWHTDDAKHWHVCECTAIVDEGAHVAGNWIVHNRPSYEAPGERHKECRTCGYWMITEPMDQLVKSPVILVNYKLTASAGEGGTITNSGTTTVRVNSKVSYTIKPNAGYMIKAVYVDGVSVGAVFKYDFANIRANHTITAEFVKYENKFTDVPADKLDIVNFVATHGLFNGVSETEFAPDTKMTRAMFVTVLGRLAGVNAEYKGAIVFTDVVAGEWYAPYVAWATDNGLIEGYGDGTFGIKDEITVEQATAILARYTERKYGLMNIVNSLSAYSDGAKVSDWAEKGVKWAVGNDIITATDGKLAPQNEPARIAVAEIFYNYAKNVLNIK